VGGRRLVDVTLDNLRDLPPEARASLYWETDTDDEPADPGFEKEEWFSGVMLEWGTCGLALAEPDRGNVAFAQFAPPSFFPRLSRFRCGRVSQDAVYLAYCYVVPARRGYGMGSQLVRAVGGSLLDRDLRALEALGDRERGDGWVLPASFLGANGFHVVREDPRYPLMRLDLSTAVRPKEAAGWVAVPGVAVGCIFYN
jgi:GNAT superfamily N-acetyltransferase